jgi:predicted dehydrogenase
MGQQAHLANYAQLRDAGRCEIAGVVDLQRDLAAAVAARYGVPRVYDDLDVALADPSVSGVVCIQQWPNNYPLVKRILQAGKSVLTEKPMVGRLEEAEELAALAAQRGVLYAVGFMKRYDPGVELAKRLVDEALASGELGPLRSVDALCNGGDWRQNAGAPLRAESSTPLPPLAPTYPDACKTQRQREAYGYLLNIFSHNVNLCHYLLGAELTPRSAAFQGSVAMLATARCGDTLVSVRGASSAAHEWRERTTLTFANGEIVIRSATPMNRQQVAEVEVLRRDGDAFRTTVHHAPIAWAFYRQAEGFVQALAGEAPLRAPADQCLWDVRVMQRIIELADVQ